MISFPESIFEAAASLTSGIPGLAGCPGQLAAAKVVAEAIRVGEHLIIQAPPYLSPGIFCCVPAILEAISRGGRVATFLEPDVRLSCWNGEMPTLVIEEGGVVMELEFPDQGSLARFQRRIAGLLVLDPPRGRGG